MIFKRFTDQIDIKTINIMIFCHFGFVIFCGAFLSCTKILKERKEIKEKERKREFDNDEENA